jgi:hypothetical protein
MDRADESALSDTHDALFEVLRKHLEVLLLASRAWARHQDIDEALIQRVRAQALALNHRRYLQHVPVYRQLAHERGVAPEADADTLVRELMLSAEVFKSYDVRWLDAADFVAMTDWLGTICIRRPAIDARPVTNITGWRTCLRADGLFVTCSSGTGGQFSFVPRDTFTLSALIGNGQWYSHTILDDAPGAPFDCLVLGPRGASMGIQAAGVGISRTAERAHFLIDAELTPDLLRAATMPAGATRSSSLEAFVDSTTVGRHVLFARAFDFLDETRRAGRRALIFGPPFLVHEACMRLLQNGRPLVLPLGSTVVTAGGWKSVVPVAAEQLEEDVARALGIPPARQVDTYSTSECNCVLIRCREGRYHAPPLLELVALDDLLLPVAGDDVFATIGFLDPFAASYPGFIVTGDRARLIRGRCACGLAGWSIASAIERAPGYVARSCAGALASVLG